jgi:hypothetical protein
MPKTAILPPDCGPVGVAYVPFYASCCVHPRALGHDSRDQSSYESFDALLPSRVARGSQGLQSDAPKVVAA